MGVLSASGPIRKAGCVLGCVCMRLCAVRFRSDTKSRGGGGGGGWLLSASGPIRKVGRGGGGGVPCASDWTQ